MIKTKEIIKILTEQLIVNNHLIIFHVITLSLHVGILFHNFEHENLCNLALTNFSCYTVCDMSITYIILVIK